MRFVLVVGADDSLHKVMTDYIGLVKMHEGDAVYALQNIDCFDQAAAAGVRQIDLRYVASDHSL